MSHPWKHSRLGWMGLSTTWSSWRWPFQSKLFWFYDSMKYLFSKIQLPNKMKFSWFFFLLQCLHSTEASTFAWWECTKWPNHKLSASWICWICVSISAGKLYQKISISLLLVFSVFSLSFLPCCMWGEKSLAKTVFMLMYFAAIGSWEDKRVDVRGAQLAFVRRREAVYICTSQKFL